MNLDDVLTAVRVFMSDVDSKTCQLSLKHRAGKGSMSVDIKNAEDNLESYSKDWEVSAVTVVIPPSQSYVDMQTKEETMEEDE